MLSWLSENSGAFGVIVTIALAALGAAWRFGALSKTVEAIGKTVASGFAQNHEDHATIIKGLSAHGERIAIVEAKVEDCRERKP
jgi:hypothetical protein